MKLSIVIPAKNEENRIGRTLEEYVKFLKKLKNEKKIKDFEIIVVLNACEDDTIGVVKKYQKKYDKLKCLNFKRIGKGFALIEGFKDALKRENDLIGFIDADFSTSPCSFYDLIKNMEKCDGAIASRAKRGSKVRMSLLRRITSRGFNFLVRSILFLPYKDTQCGAKLFKREVIDKVTPKLSLTYWAFDINLLYLCKKHKFKIKEIPTVWEDKKESKLNIARVPILMFLSIIRLRLLNSPFRDLVRFYNKIPEGIKMHHRLR